MDHSSSGLDQTTLFHGTEFVFVFEFVIHRKLPSHTKYCPSRLSYCISLFRQLPSEESVGTAHISQGTRVGPVSELQVLSLAGFPDFAHNTQPLPCHLNV
jgi:hypothetical protein